MCIIYHDLRTQSTLYFTFFVARGKNEENRNLAGFTTGFEMKNHLFHILQMCTQMCANNVFETTKNFLEILQTYS